MLRQYLKTTFRLFAKNKLVSLINLSGLTIGLAASILIVLYVSFEFSYDQSHINGERIYRVESNFYEGEVLTDEWATSAFGYGRAMKENIPGIEDFARVALDQTEQTVGYKNEFFRENTITFADPAYFTLFDFKLIEGDPRNLINEPNTVVITQSVADKLFGGRSAIGEVLSFSTTYERRECKVTGVIEDIPDNSHARFSYFISFSSLPEWKRDFWYIHEVYTYVLLNKDYSHEQVEAAFPEMAEKYKTAEALKNKTWGVSLVPLKNIHLNNWKQYERETKGNETSLYSLLIIAAVIMVIAWGNYINISIARSYQRIKEIAIRKFNGAGRGALFKQFVLEAAITNLLSLLLSGILLVLAIPYFNLLIGTSLSLSALTESSFLIFYITLFLLGTCISGLYPALVLASYKPVETIRGKIKAGKSKFSPTRVLMTTQFALSLLLITGTLIVYQQVQFMRGESLGINIREKLVLKFPAKTDQLNQRMKSFSEQLKNRHDVKNVTLSGSVPGMEVAMFLSNRRMSGNLSEENRLYEMLTVDYDYLDTYQIPMLAGRSFNRKFGNEKNKLVINESSLRLLEITNPQEALGLDVLIEGEAEPYKIIGVTKNWHQKSLTNDYTPIMMIMNDAISWLGPRYITISFTGNNTQELIAAVKQDWEDYFENSSFDYFYVNNFFDAQYKNEKNHGVLLTIFTVLGLFVSCLGLFALTSHTAHKRVKEIGVRKVLGAGTGSIIMLLSKEVVYLIGVGVAISVPLSILLMNNWLADYPFRVEIEWYIYAISILVLTTISLTTAIGQSLKVTRTNPVEALKYE